MPQLVEVEVDDDVRVEVDELFYFGRKNLRQEKSIHCSHAEMRALHVRNIRNKFVELVRKIFDVVKFYGLPEARGELQKFFAVVSRERVVVEEVNRDGGGRVLEKGEHGRADEL